MLGNTFIIPIPIEGEAKLVVLYADPRLRIFVSADRSDSAVGAWEQAGLVVVQVRSDLHGDWEWPGRSAMKVTVQEYSILGADRSSRHRCISEHVGSPAPQTC